MVKWIKLFKPRPMIYYCLEVVQPLTKCRIPVALTNLKNSHVAMFILRNDHVPCHNVHYTDCSSPLIHDYSICGQNSHFPKMGPLTREILYVGCRIYEMIISITFYNPGPRVACSMLPCRIKKKHVPCFPCYVTNVICHRSL